jgi:DNA polymerase
MTSETPDFRQALDNVLPLLEGMRGHLGRKPSTTREKLESLVGRKAYAKPTDPADTVKEKAAKIPVTAPSVSVTRTAPEPNPASAVPVICNEERFAKLAALKVRILECTKCPNLVRSRTQVVYGVGNPLAELMFVGEAPGEEEDLKGEPFIGKAGQLLTKIIGVMEYTREDIFIANVLKCRPDMPAGESGNRKPKPGEMATCLPWLREQIDLIRPKVIVALGLTAVEGLLGEPRTMRDVRGKWLDYHGVPLMPTYHPAYLLRNQTLAEKRKVWEDMLLVMEKLGRHISAKQRGYFLEKAS